MASNTHADCQKIALGTIDVLWGENSSIRLWLEPKLSHLNIKWMSCETRHLINAALKLSDQVLSVSLQWWLGADEATINYLNQCWPHSLTHICGTRGIRVNSSHWPCWFEHRCVKNYLAFVLGILLVAINPIWWAIPHDNFILACTESDWSLNSIYSDQTPHFIKWYTRSPLQVGTKAPTISFRKFVARFLHIAQQVLCQCVFAHEV